MALQRDTVQIITPSALRARHFGFILQGGVKCIVIQDDNAKIPAAAMSIHAGQLNDPEFLPGLAHFCEHMLFMGTAKYPREDEYNSYISKNGGHCNAWTEDGSTTYYFTVAHDALEGALERFVEFFVAPSFNSSALSREVEAVHSEDEKNHNVDFWRIDELERSLFDPRHPRYRYGNGNITTLRDAPQARNVDIRAELLKFFDAHYVSEAACLAVYSALPPETVLHIVEAPLSKMRVGKPSALRFLPKEDPLYAADTRGLWFNVRTIKKIRKVRIVWPVKSSAALWPSMPSDYVSYVLGHECDCSVFGVLRREYMATAMVVGPSRVDDDNDLLCVEITLTMDGLRRIVEVIDILYQGIGLAARVDSAVYAQMKAEKKINFESSDIGENADHCAALASSANQTSLQHCWAAGELLLEDDIPASEAYTAQLTPENGVVMLAWGDMPCDDAATPAPVAKDEEEEGNEECEEEQGEEEEEEETEEKDEAASGPLSALPEFAQLACNSATRFHMTKFSKCRIPDEIIVGWAASRCGPRHPALALPPANPFLSTEFTVYASDGRHATVETFHTPYGVALVRKDAGHHKSFNTSIIWRCLSPCAYASPRNLYYMHVLRAILNDAVAEISYFGLLAALQNDIQLSAGGLVLSVTGPQHRIMEFFFAIFEKLFTPAVLCGSVEMYSNYAEREMRALQSKKTKQPYTLAGDRFMKAARVVAYTFDEVMEAAVSTSYEEYQTFVNEYLASGVYFDCFVAGNIPSSKDVQSRLIEGAQEILSRLHVSPACKEKFPKFCDTYAFPCVSSLPHAPLVDVLIYPPFDETNSNVAVLFDIYVGEETPLLRALCDSTHQLFSSSFFDTLRTRETLGYVVYSQSLRVEGTAHLQFFVQSAVEGVDGAYLLSRIIAFLAAVEEKLETVCAEAEVKTVVNGLIERRRKLPESVEKDALDLLHRHLHPVDFAHKELEIEELKQLDPAKVKEFFRTHVANSSNSRRALAVVVHNAASVKNDALDGADGVRRTVTLPPRRPGKGSVEEVDNESTESVLQLPDFVAAPMCITVQKHPSPEDFHRHFPIVPGKSF